MKNKVMEIRIDYRLYREGKAVVEFLRKNKIEHEYIVDINSYRLSEIDGLYTLCKVNIGYFSASVYPVVIFERRDR